MVVGLKIVDTLIESRYGKKEYNIKLCDVVVRDFILHVHPEGIGNKLDIDALEKYGLAIHFAKMLLRQEEFSLSAPFGKERNVYCGHILDLATLKAVIVIDRSTVEFLTGGDKSFLSLSDGHPIASAYVKGFGHFSVSNPIEIYFRKKVIPAP